MLFSSLWGVVRKYFRHPDPKLRSIRLLNVVAICVGLLWAVAGLILSSVAITLLAVVLIVTCLASVQLAYRGRWDLGRLIWFTVISGIIFVAQALIAPAGDIDQLYAAVVAAAFVNISPMAERKLLYTVGANILGFWVAGVTWAPGLLGPPLIGEDIAQRFVSKFSLVTTVMSIAGTIAVYSTVSETHRSQLELRRAEAEETSRAKSAFLASMSHEIRTPMNAIMGMADLLAASDLNEIQRNDVEVILESSSGLLRIINDMLDMASIEVGKLSLAHDAFNLQKAVESAVNSLRGYARQRHVEIHLTIDPAVPESIIGDMGRLRQIIINLLGNAIKFSRRPPDEPMGMACLQVQVDENAQLLLTITDNGVGISPEDLPQIFEPFFRSASASARPFDGTGLGLSIVHEIVEKMGGYVSVQSALGLGSTAKVVLPIVTFDPAPPPVVRPPTQIHLIGLNKQQVGFWHSIGNRSWLHVATYASIDDQGLRDLRPSDEANDIFVISLYDERGVERQADLNLLRQSLPSARVIAHSLSGANASGLLDAKTYILNASPALPSHALEGVLGLSRAVERVEQTQSPPDTAKTDTPAPAPASLNVLVVEDNEINQIVIANQLEKMGHKVVLAANGLEGLAKWRAERPDIVLTDCHMPEMDGFDMTIAMRQEEKQGLQAASPIIGITANAVPSELKRCLDSGMDDVFTKPVRMAELSRIVEKYGSADRLKT